MRNKKNIILIIILIVTVVWIANMFLKKDTYIGFYYPSASNLMNDIQSGGSFDSLDGCRNWIDEQVFIYNQNNSNYDYECGKNCDLSGGKPYICEETLQ